MKQYSVTGMSCAACSARVEKAVLGVEGVTSCAVSLLTNSMGVAGTASDSAVIRAVEKAGYGAFVRDKNAAAAPEELFADRETPALKKRILASSVFLLGLLYCSMGHTIFALPLPAFFSENPVALGLLQMLLSAAVLLINKKFFLSGARGMLHGAPNMDTLVSLGSSVSFCRSVAVLFQMTDALEKEGAAAAAKLSGGLYFESAAMILVFISVGKLLEAKSKGKTTNALQTLIKLAPKTARVIRNGTELTVPAEEIAVGDIFTVKPGESIPADGVITEGSTSVNESALTGEGLPVDKAPGNSVSAATVNLTGFVTCRATRVGEDTALSQIIRLVSEAAATKAPIAKTADKVSRVFVPAVCGLAAVTFIGWLFAGRSFEFALARAVSVLVVSCPCALGLATPVAVLVGSGVGAKNGILFKNAAVLENTGRIDIAVLDKTGTLTAGVPAVVKVCPAEGITEEELLRTVYSAELKSEHPLAGAVTREAEKRGIVSYDTGNFRVVPGKGVSALVNGKTVYAGSAEYIGSFVNGTDRLRALSAAGTEDGNSMLAVAEENRLLGILYIADTLKPDSVSAVKELNELGIRVVMLTGDAIGAAKNIGFYAGIDNVIAGVLPDGKEAVIKRLQKLGRVAMIGDGINDAPALTAADTGIAIGAGTDVAIDAADVVLMNSRLSDAAAAVRLSRASLRNIRENLFWAFIYNAFCIPFAAGCFVGIFNRSLSPELSAAAMSLSSFCVVLNALRLNLFHSRSGSGRKTQGRVDEEELKQLVDEINKEREGKLMQKTIKIEGMMCPRCEAHVKKALEALDGVESAAPDFQKGIAVLTLEKDVLMAEIKDAVENAGYTLTETEN